MTLAAIVDRREDSGCKAHAPAKQRAAVAAMLKTIFAQANKADAEAQWDAVAEALGEKQPKLRTLMESSWDDVLAYMDFPCKHWPRSPPRTCSSV